LRRFFIEHSAGLAADKPLQSISGSDANHIKNVLRLKPSDKIMLFDGSGNEYEAEIVCMESDKVTAAILGSSSSLTESPVQITVAQGFLKDKKMDTLVRQTTELGITGWLPVITRRSVPRPDSRRLDTRAERWKKIATEALKQCRRGCIPDIQPAVSFKEAVSIGNAYNLKIIFWENETLSFFPWECRTPVRQGTKIFIMLGPEGGFTSDEVEIAAASGFVTASLGPRILRAETAAIAACTLVQYFFGDMGKKDLTTI